MGRKFDDDDKVPEVFYEPEDALYGDDDDDDSENNTFVDRLLRGAV